MIRQSIGTVAIRDVRAGKNIVPIKISGQHHGIFSAEILRLRQVACARLQIRAQRGIDGLGERIETTGSEKND